MEPFPQNLGYLFQKTAQRHPDKTALLAKVNGQYAPVSWKQFAQKIEAVATALIENGVKAGDCVAILSENRPEWVYTDLAAQFIGAISVPIYTSLSPTEIQYILSDSGASVLAVSTKPLLEKLLPVQRALPNIKTIIGFDASTALLRRELTANFFPMKDIENKRAVSWSVEESLKSVLPDSVASIIYTSGTTGAPKGVMLTHSNFIHNVVYVSRAFKMSGSDVLLSFLPLSHVFERTTGYYLMIYAGATIAYAESMDLVPKNLIEIKPTFILGVPRFYEKIKARVVSAVEQASSIKKGLFFWAMALGIEKNEVSAGLKSGRPFLKLEYWLAKKLIYKKFRASLGGRIRFCVSGGAALPKDVADFFSSLDVLICEGYGLSETSPVMTANREDRFRFGTVGIPIEGVEVKIAEDGEIITRGPCVMKGYLNKHKETEEVLKDGWFYTGDLGQFDKDGFLKITGRKKELIVTSGGKKIAPAPIEEIMEKDPFILRCVLFGEGRQFMTALIVPKKEPLLEYAKEQKIAFQTYKDLLKNQKIIQFLEARIELLSHDLAGYEKIKYFVLLEFDFSQESGELTPTLKVKRSLVHDRYKDLLLPFYQKDSIAS